MVKSMTQSTKPVRHRSVAQWPFENGGAVLEAQSPQRDALFRLDATEIINRLRLHGVVLFRSFRPDLSAFEQFTALLGTSDPARHPSLHGRTRDVFTGRKALSPHSELAYTPWPPDLLWLYCVQPAAADGRTTIYDGVEFLKQMPESLRLMFETRRLKYSQVFSPHGWSGWYGRSREELSVLFDEWGVDYRFNEANCLFTEYCTSAIRTTKFGGQPAFVNSVIHALDHPEFYGLTFEDGLPIPPDVAAELRAMADRIVEHVSWTTAGDFVVIDNTRWMHGREAYEDPGRLIRALHAMAAFT